MDPFSFAIATVAQIGISYLFPSEGPRLKDLKISASSYGAAIPWVFGLARVPGNMIWSLPIREQKKKKSAGKGGSYNDYSYYCTFAMGLCRGPVDQVRRVWADNKLIYDGTGGISGSSLTVTDRDSLKAAIVASVGGGVTSKYRMRFYHGGETQLPDSAMESNLGAGNTPAFRGLAYILFDDLPLEDFGNRIPQITAEVLVGQSVTTVSVSPLKEIDNLQDLDPDYAPGEAAFDLLRSLVFVRYGDRLKAISLTNARTRLEYAAVDFGFASGDRLSRLLCSGPDGALFVLRGEIGAQAKLDRLDAFSMQSTHTQSAVPSPVLAVCATASAGDPRLLTIASDGQARQFNALDLTPVWEGSLPGAVQVCARDADASGSATFFILRLNNGVLTLTRLKGVEIEDLWTTPANAAGPILWDGAMTGVLIFHHTDGARLSKWSEDTGDQSWRVNVAGYPSRISPASRLLDGRIGWLYAGRLYGVDTATGDSLEGVASGSSNRSLGINAQTMRDYQVFGWAQADSPEAFAAAQAIDQDQFPNPDQLPDQNGPGAGSGGGGPGSNVGPIYPGMEQGQGIALEADYAGQSAQTQAMDTTRGVLVALDGLNGIVKASNIASGVSVGTIVSRLLVEGGLPLVRTDLTAINAMPLRGYGWASGTDIKGVFAELQRLYLFDLVECDGLLVARVRGSADNGLDKPVEIISQNALGSSSEASADYWQETRFQESDLPASFTLTYMNIDNDFETSTARSVRISNPTPTMFSRQQVAMEVNVVMSAKEAKAQVNKILHAQWAERTKHATRLGWSYLMLDPGDVVRVEMNDGRSYEDRLRQTEVGADFSLAVESYSQDAGAYDGWEDVSADGGGSGGSIGIAPPSVALPFIFNTPLIRDQDDQGGSISVFYVGFGNALPEQAFAGAALFRSTNNVDYSAMLSPDGDVEWATVVGERLGPPPAGPFALDWKTRLTLRPGVTWFDLEPVTDDELWAGANLCLVGDEIIQFRDCEENPDGTWTLWNLLRARRGTEYACNIHRAGERFVFLANSTIAYGVEQTSARGQPRYFKAVASGGSLQDQAPLQVNYEPRDLMPYAPVDIRRTRSEAGDITITWARRTRLGGNMQDGTAVVPLAERAERYEAYVLPSPFTGDASRGLPPALFRQGLNLTGPEMIYTTAMQAQDGFDPQTDALHIVVYQLSDAVGRGFPGARSIEPDEAF